jgi:hypothetical protein
MQLDKEFKKLEGFVEFFEEMTDETELKLIAY